jgi:hypothetical protein
MDNKMAFIRQNHTWTLTYLSPGRQFIATKWVHCTKSHPNGSSAKLKVCLVAKGFQQCKGIDFEETYASIAKYNTLRTLNALASHHGWLVRHLDVKTALLNGGLLEDVYIMQFEGYVSPRQPT